MEGRRATSDVTGHSHRGAGEDSGSPTPKTKRSLSAKCLGKGSLSDALVKGASLGRGGDCHISLALFSNQAQENSLVVSS